MSGSAISTSQRFPRFPDAESAREYLESRRWPNGPVCPQCFTSDRITVRHHRPGFYRCNRCKDFDFTVRTGTFMERSKVPVHKWLYAIRLLVAAGPQGHLSGRRLAEEIGVTQKTAWFILRRLREARKWHCRPF